MTQTRRVARADLGLVLARAARDESPEFVDGWFTDEAQARLTALVVSLTTTV